MQYYISDTWQHQQQNGKNSIQLTVPVTTRIYHLTTSNFTGSVGPATKCSTHTTVPVLQTQKFHGGDKNTKPKRKEKKNSNNLSSPTIRSAGVQSEDLWAKRLVWNKPQRAWEGNKKNI